MLEIFNAPERPISDEPTIEIAWRHGLVGTLAVNAYIVAVRAEIDKITYLEEWTTDD